MRKLALALAAMLYIAVSGVLALAGYAMAIEFMGPQQDAAQTLGNIVMILVLVGSAFLAIENYQNNGTVRKIIDWSQE